MHGLFLLVDAQHCHGLRAISIYLQILQQDPVITILGKMYAFAVWLLDIQVMRYIFNAHLSKNMEC